MFRKVYEAILLGRASHAAARGKIESALSLLNRLGEPRYNQATTHALGAHLELASLNNPGARLRIDRCRSSIRAESASAAFLSLFCDALVAFTAGDLAKFNDLRDQLNAMPASFAKKMLVVVGPAFEREFNEMRTTDVESTVVH